MKKFRLFSMILVFVMLLAVGLCFTPKSSGQFSAVDELEEEETPTAQPFPEGIFTYITISQEDYVFKSEDFYRGEDDENYTLYTNKALSITANYQLGSSISENRLTISYDNVPICEKNIVNEEAEDHVLIVDGVPHFFFKLGTHESTTEIRISVINYQGAEITLTFDLVQIPFDFRQGTQISWQFIDDKSLPKNVNALTNDCAYSPLTLSIPDGTQLNPIYVKFIYCGETFSLYSIKGVLFNGQTDAPLNFDEMHFDVSGTYTVEIYDNTMKSNSSTKNYYKTNFTIDNRQSASTLFYFNAYVENRSRIIMDGQITNDKTIVEFVNLGATMVKNHVSKIVVTRYYGPDQNSQISVPTEYDNKKIESEILRSNDATTGYLEFDQDGIYIIEVNFDSASANQKKTFSFNLIKSIRTYLKVDDYEYTLSDSEASNTIKRYDTDMKVETHYTSSLSPLTSYSEYSFYVNIARSAVSIDGVKNNARKSGSVDLVVRGVGTLNVDITHDGKTYTRQFQSGDNIPTFSERGKYVIRVTDEMGMTTQKTFSITAKMNAAATVLIILAGVVLLFGIVFIIISRMKVKVR